MAAAGPHATSGPAAAPWPRRAGLLVWRVGPAFAVMGVIWWLSAQPHLKTDLGWGDLVLRKCAHVTEFALLTLLWARALRWGGSPLRQSRVAPGTAAHPSSRPGAGLLPRGTDLPRGVGLAGGMGLIRGTGLVRGTGLLPPTAAIAAAAAIALGWAIVDERHQHFVSGRVGSPRDVAIDAIGIAVAVLLWRAAARRRARPAAAPAVSA